MFNLTKHPLTPYMGLVACTGLMAWTFAASQDSQKAPTPQSMDEQFNNLSKSAQEAFTPFQGDAPEPKDPPTQTPKKRTAPTKKVVEKRPVRSKRAVTYKPATLVVVTNFEKANIKVNGLPYPAPVVAGKQDGMVLPAGGPYKIEVTYDGKTRKYTLSLRPYEKRYLIVELSGYKASKATTKPISNPIAKPIKKEPDAEKGGRVTVYAKPRGVIILDGKTSGKKAPNTVTASLGRHEVQVRYEDGEVSEKKIVRVRKNSRIKLFFRQRKKK